MKLEPCWSDHELHVPTSMETLLFRSANPCFLQLIVQARLIIIDQPCGHDYGARNLVSICKDEPSIQIHDLSQRFPGVTGKSTFTNDVLRALGLEGFQTRATVILRFRISHADSSFVRIRHCWGYLIETRNRLSSPELNKLPRY